MGSLGFEVGIKWRLLIEQLSREVLTDKFSGT